MKDLRNNSMRICLIWELCAQLVVAFSTWTIIKASATAVGENPKDALIYLAIFVICLTVVFLPNALARLNLIKWKFESFRSYVDRFSKIHSGRQILARNNFRCRTEPWLTSEARNVFDDTCETLYQMFSTFLNSAVNILVVGLILDPAVIGYYVVATLILFVVHRGSKPYIARKAASAQSCRNTFVETLLAGFVNIINPTKIFQKNWTKSFEKSYHELIKSESRYSIASSLVSFVGTISALSIICLGVGIFLFTHTDSPALFVGMLVTIPRQVQIIQSGFYFFGLSVHWSGMRERLKSLESESLSSIQVNVEEDIKFPTIQLYSNNTNQVISDFSTLLSMTSKPGRYTLRGPNGCGKSTLLALFSESLKDKKIVFLPTIVNQLFAQTSGPISNSSGKTMLTILESIVDQKDIEVLLLDEWDANLDDSNINQIDKELSELAQRVSVVEIRHRD